MKRPEFPDMNPPSLGPPQRKGPDGAQIARSFIDGVLTEEFWAKNWEKYPKHIRSADLAKDKQVNRLGEFVNPDHLSEILRRGGSSLKMFRKGQPFDGDSLYLAYLEGASLILNQADRYSKPLFEFCRTIADKHFYHSFAVAYLTPPNSHAVRLHNDDQDVFLLQIWGKKNWLVRPAPTFLPYTEEMIGKDAPVPEELIKPPILDFTIEAGDILFMPRGFLHEAKTGTEPSLHITITVPTSDYCWGVLLGRYLGHSLQKSLPSGSEVANFCQEAMSEKDVDSHRPDRKKRTEEEENAMIRQVASAFLKDLSSKEVVGLFEERMATTNKGQEEALMMNCSRQLRPFVTSESLVRLMPGVGCSCTPGAEVARFTRDGKILDLPIASTASHLIAGLTNKPRAVSELHCEDSFERLCVLEALLMKGCVQMFAAP